MPHRTPPATVPDLFMPVLSDQELRLFIEMIYEECGIALKPEKRSMIASRLSKRLKALGLHSFQDYLGYLDDAGRRANELVAMVDAMTTNKTDFFREENHFAFLTRTALPELTGSASFRAQPLLRVWSAGCSTGEEPYTLAMVLDDYFSGRGGDYSILATDIAVKVLRQARAAVYAEPLVAPVPAPFRQKYLMSGKGERRGQYRVVPELRSKVTFGRLNFMDPDYQLGAPMDVIFCRNVIIYFDWDTKVQVIRKLYRALRPGGYLFVGHSETLNGIDLEFRRIVPTIFQKTGR